MGRWWTSPFVEPKRKSRFLVEIGSSFVLRSVKTCTKPTANVDIKEFQLINHKFKYPGIVTWAPIKMTFIDMAGSSFEKAYKEDGANSIARVLNKMLQFTGYNIPTKKQYKISRTGVNRKLSVPEKASTIANSFGGGLFGADDRGAAQVTNSEKDDGTNNQSVKIHTIDPSGKKSVETWILHNPQIKSISWGDLAYDSDEFVEYTLEVEYDFADMKFNQSLPSLKTPNVQIVENLLSNVPPPNDDLLDTLNADNLGYVQPDSDSVLDALGDRGSLGSGGTVDSLTIGDKGSGKYADSAGYDTQTAFDPTRSGGPYQKRDTFVYEPHPDSLSTLPDDKQFPDD